jgi:rSAM/selenodomain-associated transferase 1
MQKRKLSMRSGGIQRRVLLFVRAPELGRVKTRLEKKMDAATVLRLYRCFVQDIIETLATGGYDMIVFFTPPHKGSAVQAWLGDTVPVQAQTGKTLGDRMRNAFSDVFAGGVDQAVLMGSDFPDLDNGIIDKSFEYLKQKESVIGPAEDGGYYLIGFRKNRFNNDLFSDVDWGSASVFRQTLGKIHAAGLSCHTLPSWQDIDTHDDLVAFYHRSKANGLSHLKTMKLLDRLNLKEFQ